MRGALLATTTAVLLSAVAASLAAAAYDPVGSGQARLTLEPSFASFLQRNEIKLVPSQGAKREGATYTLPITGGQFDPTVGKGQADAEGTLTFQSQRKQVPLRAVRVKAARQPLIAKVGGSQLKLVLSKQTSTKRAGFGTKLTSTKLALTQKLITRLNKKLRPKLPFKPNQALGTLTANVQPQLVTIEEKGEATITLDSAFLAKLDEHSISLNPIAPAQRFGTQASFPIIAGGSISPVGTEGTLRTGGELEFLQLGAGQVFWHELWLELPADSDSAEVDIEPTPTFPGKIGRVGVLDYAPAAVSSNPKARTISVAGAPLSLSIGAAQSFNQAFAQGQAPVFGAGEAVGTLSFGAMGE